MSVLLILVEIACQYILQFKTSVSLVTDKEIMNFTLIVIQSEPLLQNICTLIYDPKYERSMDNLFTIHIVQNCKVLYRLCMEN